MTLFLWILLSVYMIASFVAGIVFLLASSTKDVEVSLTRAGVAIIIWFIAYTAAVWTCGYLIGANL